MSMHAGASGDRRYHRHHLSRSLLPSSYDIKAAAVCRQFIITRASKFATRHRTNERTNAINTQGGGGWVGRNREGRNKDEQVQEGKEREKEKRRSNSLTRVNHDDTATRLFAPRDPPPEVFSSPPVRRFPPCHSARHSPPTFTGGTSLPTW